MFTWLCGHVAMCLCGYVALWLCGYVATWLYGNVAILNFVRVPRLVGAYYCPGPMWLISDYWSGAGVGVGMLRGGGDSLG